MVAASAERWPKKDNPRPPGEEDVDNADLGLELCRNPCKGGMGGALVSDAQKQHNGMAIHSNRANLQKVTSHGPHCRSGSQFDGAHPIQKAIRHKKNHHADPERGS